MVENPASELRNPRDLDPDSDSSPSELRFEEVSHGGNGGVEVEDGRRESSGLGAFPTVGSNAARYKSMSPASLPISRSPFLTIPPGLSPTSLLESPVMLLDLKAEPSPTTGSFSMPLPKHVSVNSDSHFLLRDANNNSTCDERSYGEFEFKPHTNSGSGSIISSSGHLASVGSNYHQSKPFAQVQARHEYQNFVHSSATTVESIKASSDEFTLPIPASAPPVYTDTSMANAPHKVATVDLRQRQGSDCGNQPMTSDNTDNKEPKSLAAVEKSSEDGYNWRKYGQKLVKGSEFPRSYYKCTHPNCQVKKQFERSLDGHITEVIYKGSHDHPKPIPGRRSAVGAILSSQTEELCDGLSSLISAEDKFLNAHSHQSHQVEPVNNFELSPVSASEDDIEAVGARSNKNGDDVDDDDEDDDPESKRRKRDIDGTDVIQLIKGTREPRVVVQTLSEVDILDDGYRWRKYGQKVVKGNPNPRSYYKCTNAGCPVRKHVERASHDPKAVITTYEGKHNHDVPAGRTSSHDATGSMIRNDTGTLNSQVSQSLNGMLRTDETMKVMMPRCSGGSDGDIVSLDLGVGICSSPENRANERQQTANTQAHTQIGITGSGCNRLIQANPFSAYYGSLLKEDGGVDSYGPRETTPPLNHPTDRYGQNTGRLVMGP